MRMRNNEYPRCLFDTNKQRTLEELCARYMGNESFDQPGLFAEAFGKTHDGEIRLPIDEFLIINGDHTAVAFNYSFRVEGEQFINFAEVSRLIKARKEQGDPIGWTRLPEEAGTSFDYHAEACEWLVFINATTLTVTQLKTLGDLEKFEALLDKFLVELCEALSDSTSTGVNHA